MVNGVKKERDIALDIARICAFSMVVALHALLNTGFYTVHVVGWKMCVLVAFRTLFITCVPLFLLLTGYLESQKKIEMTKDGILSFYKKISKVVFIWLASTIITEIAFKLFIDTSLPLWLAFLNIIRFAHYNWYVKMYFGLFLLIPFLNLIWQGISDKKGKRVLVIVLMFLVVTPTVFDGFNVSSLDTFLHPSRYEISWAELFPNYYTGLYPFMYYFIGAYIREYVEAKSLKLSILVPLLAVSLFTFTIYALWNCYDTTFRMGPWADYWSYQNLIDSVLVFLIINRFSFKGIQGKARKAIALISDLTFGAYMLSVIPDNIFYPKLNAQYPDYFARIKYYPLYVIRNIVIALILSYFVYLLRKMVLFFVAKKRNK